MPDIQNFQIIGIDCAADPENIGVAYARHCRTQLEVQSVRFGATKKSGTRTERLQRLADEISGEIDSNTLTLVAMDAPLGWPTEMGDILGRHSAGSSCGFPADADADRFFRRQTDLFVECRTKKSPIEVGADRIARATHTSLRLLGMIRERHQCVMAHEPLTSTDSATPTVWVIEVYPALAAPFFFKPVAPKDADVEKQRKKPEYWFWSNISSAVSARKKGKWAAIVDEFSRQPNSGTDADAITISAADRNDTTGRPITKAQQDHGLDAILAAWTGHRFCLKECIPPDDSSVKPRMEPRTLKQEGWIWFDKRLPERVQKYRPSKNN